METAMNGDETATESKSETKAEVVARLLKMGGKVLVVGGGVTALPRRYTTHPQLVFWDDQRQSHEHREVPSNTRGVIVNRWCSHATMRRVRDATERMRIPLFAMLRTHEIKELLTTFIEEMDMPIPEPRPRPTDAQIAAALEGARDMLRTIPPTQMASATPAELPAPPESPDIDELLAADETAPELDMEVPAFDPTPMARATEQTVALRHFNRGEQTKLVKEEMGTRIESVAGEARRLLALFKKKYGITSTQGSMEQALRVVMKAAEMPPPSKADAAPATRTTTKTTRGKDKGRRASRKPAPGQAVAVATDGAMAEVLALMQQASEALTFAIEAIPKIQAEMAALRASADKHRAKLLALLDE
jgi:hypothetical protein